MTKFYQELSKDYENAPKHESMRAKINREQPGWGADYYYRGDWEAYNWVNKFLESCVGKQFSEAYSKVCSKFRKSKNIKYRNTFKSYIDSYYMNATHNDYYLDDNNIIRKYKSCKKHIIWNSHSYNEIGALLGIH